MVDFIIPLGVGSRHNNDELRLLLRSLEKNGVGYRNIIIVATEPPNWLTNVTVHTLGDPLKTNKDGNIINKVRYAITKTKGITPEFVWSCDDCVVLDKFDFATMPPIYNVRAKHQFANSDRRWYKRVHRTFTFLEDNGVKLLHNYESHTPQRFPTASIENMLKTIDYESDIGYSINTLFYGMLGVTGGFDQRLFKSTVESAKLEKDSLTGKALLGYNDDGFSVLRNKLFSLFPNKSKYER